LILIFLIGCDPQSSSDKQPENLKMNPVSSQSDSSPPQTQTPYNHPMQDGFTQRGIIFQEVKDDMNCRRYVSGEQITVDENDNEIVFSGISTIERRPMSQDELDDLVATGQRDYQRNYNSAPIISPGLEQLGRSKRIPLSSSKSRGRKRKNLQVWKLEWKKVPPGNYRC
jgi:hypothetical protein